MSVLYVALSDKSVDVAKVIAMMKEMVISLQMKQSEDDSKKPHCIKIFEETEPTPFPL